MKRKEQQATHSDIDQSDDSWGEIRSNLPRGRSTRNTRGETRRIAKRDSLDSRRSSRKRTPSYNSASPRESDHSIRRPTDLFRTASKKCEPDHIRDLPSCLRQTLPRSTDRPLSLKFDPTMLPDATKQRDDMDKVADVIMSLQGEKSGNVELAHSELVGETIFALRGSGEFQVRWGIGAYGEELNDHIRRTSAYEKEEVIASGVRCLIPNRMAYGLSTLKMGTSSR